MNAATRIIKILLLEQMRKHEKFSKELGLVDKSTISNEPKRKKNVRGAKKWKSSQIYSIS